MGLRLRIITVVVFACSIINLFLCFYITEQIRTLELQSLRTKIDKATYMMRLVNARPLYNVDKETLKINLETFFDDQNMKSIEVKEADIDLDVHLEREFEANGIDIQKIFFIYHKGIKLGKMKVVYSSSLIEKKLAGFRTQMLYFTFTITLLLAIILVFLINKLMQPVTKLAQAASEIAAGNLEKEIEQNGVGEVGELSRNFSSMRDAIQDKINDLALTNKNLENEIQLKEVNEKKILHQSMVISSVNTFFQKSMLAHSYREIAELFIPIALTILPSKYCFIGELSEDDPDQLDILAVFGRAMPDDGSMGKALRVKPINGILSRVISEDVSVIANDPGSHPGFMEMPESHIPLDSFLGVPIKLGSKVKGIVAFAGKENGYDAGDKESAEMMAVALIEALSLKKQEDEKLKLEEMMVQSEKMVSLGGLAAGMAHEINNPLAGILQNSQVIQNRLGTKLPANIVAAREVGIELDDLETYMAKREIYKMIDSVMDAGKRAAAIVSNMLSFSRKSSSGFIPEDVCLLLDQTLELAASDYNLKKKFDFKKIAIKKKYARALPKASCKASELQQVFFNILSNGAQSMMGMEIIDSPCFVLKIFQEDTYVCIQIRDNGPGMEANTKKRVFEPFFTTKTVGDGTGLGLAVSYFIITENHKGSIEVDSSPGKGSSFLIKLPLDKDVVPKV
ncbi:MAG: GAF domain-containing protein [Desulfobacteraceae bacterium]|nr:GAF domain-containing protein [Desulfobacteraceae bacterium]